MNQKPFNNKLSNDDFNKLPDLETYISNLDKLDKTDFSNMNQAEIARKFLELATIVPLTFKMMAPQNFNNINFYRVRANLNQDEDESLIRTHSFPSSFFCKKNGRANLKSKPVFYCCDNLHGAIMESQLEPGQTGYLSLWRAFAERSIKTSFVLSETIPITNRWHTIANDTLDYQSRFYNVESEKYAKHFLKLTQLINKKFMSEKEPYYLTSWLSNAILYEDHWNDALVYPSFASSHQYCNFAIHPNTVVSLIKFVRVGKFIVKEKGSDLHLKIAIGGVGE